jgi:hypothetical protein
VFGPGPAPTGSPKTFGQLVAGFPVEVGPGIIAAEQEDIWYAPVTSGVVARLELAMLSGTVS